MFKPLSQSSQKKLSLFLNTIIKLNMAKIIIEIINGILFLYLYNLQNNTIIIIIISPKNKMKKNPKRLRTP